MTPQQVVGMGVRLFAIFLALTALQYASTVPVALARSGWESGAPAYMVAIGYATAALALWHFPMVVAHKLVPRTHDQCGFSPQLYDLARVGCALLGLWLLIRSLPAATSLFFRAYLVSGTSGSIFGSMSVEAKLDLLYYAVELSIALFMLIRSASAARFILRAGESKADEADSLGPTATD